MTPDHFVKAIPLPCAFIAPDGWLGAVNPEFEALFGAEVTGRPYATAFRQPALLDRIETAMETATATQARYIGRAGGRETHHSVTISPLAEDAGWLLVFEDVTDAEEAGERRSEFVSNVSHELRTPLTAISGFVETLRGPARDDARARKEFLSTMARETKRMTRLVDDLLSLARVEDVARLRPSGEVDITILIRDAVSGLKPRAKDRGTKLKVVGCKAPVLLPGDPDQLTQVFTNLIENAIKYGREGGAVTITLKTSDDTAQMRGPGVSVAVRDNGDGIEAHHIGRLTERFYRVDSHRSRGMGGTGLGLAIVKHIVNRHRGRLRIFSKPGKGSRFTVFLPFE